jgi:hypothetical protein
VRGQGGRQNKGRAREEMAASEQRQVVAREQEFELCELKLVFEPLPNTCKLWTWLQNGDNPLLQVVQNQNKLYDAPE